MSASTLLDIIQGEDRVINVYVKEESGKPYDLTGFTEVEAVLKGTSGDISITETADEIDVASAEGGHLQLKLTDTVTGDLKLGTASFELIIDKGTERRIVQYSKVFNIKSRL